MTAKLYLSRNPLWGYPFLFVLLVTLLFSGCNGADDETPPPPAPDISTATNLSLLDIANAAGAHDMELSFLLASNTNISEIRLFILKEAQAGSFDLTQAEAASSDRYQIVDPATRKVRIASDQLDFDGEAVIEGQGYVVFAQSIASGMATGNKLSNGSNILELAQESAVSTLVDFVSAGSGGMDADADGNIYMGDFGATLNGGGNKVVKITPDGAVSTFASGLNGASGNDFDAEGNLIQSSITGSFISSITPAGVVSTVASSGINGPVGVVVAVDGSLFVANCGNSTIWKVDPSGVTSMFSQSALLATCPNGLDLDVSGNLYTALFGNGNIIKITPDGTASIFATIPGNNNGHLLIHGDLMYVIARSAHQVYTVNITTAEVKLFAGTGSRGVANGALDQATFSFPNDLALSPDGTKIYINDVDPNAGASSNISPVVIRVIDLVD